MLTCRAAVTAMRANPDGPAGSIIVNSSMSAYKPMGNFVGYSTTKGALIALSKSVAIHCANQGTRIRANSIHPGVVETDMIKNIIAKQPDPAAARATYEAWPRSAAWRRWRRWRRWSPSSRRTRPRSFRAVNMGSTARRPRG
jgi:NAD(P)-dependent dehydrogenase (short-subunit alcohol dehydrogenase family)